MTLEVILRAVFGVADPQRRERLRRLLPALIESTASASQQYRILLARQVNRPGPRVRLRALNGEIDALLFAEIAERRADPATANRQDILSMLAVARFEDGSMMSDHEVRDQLVTLLLAGHETTSTALAWTVDLLLHAPAELKRLTKELTPALTSGICAPSFTRRCGCVRSCRWSAGSSRPSCERTD